MQAEPARFLEAPAGDSGDRFTLSGWIEEWARLPENQGALRHREVLAARPARFGDLALPLPEPVAEALGHHGISRLYTHQVQAIESLRGGLEVIILEDELRSRRRRTRRRRTPRSAAFRSRGGRRSPLRPTSRAPDTRSS